MPVSLLIAIPKSPMFGVILWALLVCLRSTQVSLATTSAEALGMPEVKPERMVSIEVCADQLLLLIAQPEQIASVSKVAIDARMSMFASQARQYPLNTGKVDAILAHRPDVVIVGAFTPQAVTRTLTQLGIHVVKLQASTEPSDIKRNITMIADIAHQAIKKQRLLANLEHALTMINANAQRVAGTRVLLFGANGYTQGPNSFIGKVLALAGFENAAAEIGITTAGHLNLEHVIALAPQYLITPESYPGQSRAESPLSHRILQRLDMQTVQTTAQWMCPTPAVFAAMQTLQNRAMESADAELP